MNSARKQKLRRHVATVCSIAALMFGVTGSNPAQAQEFPGRPITVIVPFAPGGSSDTVMRLVARKVSESIKQTVIIDNRPGGSGNVAAMAVKNAPPDGYLLMMGHSGTHAVNPSLYANLKFDPVKDFQPITGLISFNNILVVPEGSPVKSVADLIALGKSKPEGLSFGSQGIGTGGHLLGELIGKQTGAKLVHVPYRGVAPALTDLIAGRLDMMFSSYISAASHIEGGKLRMIAIAGTQRHPQIPDVPTMPEAGYPETHLEQWFGVFGPAGLPAPIVRKLNDEFVKALRSDEARDLTAPQVARIIAGTPEDLAALVTRDLVRLGKIVKDSGATIQ